MHVPSPGLEDARGRKRERDKQNQRRKRQREKDALEDLERRNVSLERQVQTLRQGVQGDVQNLADTVDSLRSQNAALLRQLNQVNQFVETWTSQRPDGRTTTGVNEGNESGPRDGRGGQPSGLPMALLSTTASERSDVRVSQSPRTTSSESAFLESTSGPLLQFAAVGLFAHQTSEDAIASSHSRRGVCTVAQRRTLSSERHLESASDPTEPSEITIPASMLENALELSAWQRLPLWHIVLACDDPFGSIIQEMRASPLKFQECDPQPQALDLLLGGSLNGLANAIFHVTVDLPARQPEKLALQLVAYHMMRWLIEPSKDNYDRMPLMFRPTPRQLFVPHPPCIDLFAWPQLRDNLIKHWGKYSRVEVIGLFICTCRIRDTPNSTFIIRNPGAEPYVDPEFLRKVFSVDGWVLLDKFWIEYPELVEGMDRDKFMISEKDLM